MDAWLAHDDKIHGLGVNSIEEREDAETRWEAWQAAGDHFTAAERERCVALIHKHAEALLGYFPGQARLALIAEIEKGEG